jgi:hypothetical protein
VRRPDKSHSSEQRQQRERQEEEEEEEADRKLGPQFAHRLFRTLEKFMDRKVSKPLHFVVTDKYSLTLIIYIPGEC